MQALQNFGGVLGLRIEDLVKRLVPQTDIHSNKHLAQRGHGNSSGCFTYSSKLQLEAQPLSIAFVCGSLSGSRHGLLKVLSVFT